MCVCVYVCMYVYIWRFNPIYICTLYISVYYLLGNEREVRLTDGELLDVGRTIIRRGLLI